MDTKEPPTRKAKRHTEGVGGEKFSIRQQVSPIYSISVSSRHLVNPLNLKLN